MISPIARRLMRNSERDDGADHERGRRQGSPAERRGHLDAPRRVRRGSRSTWTRRRRVRGTGAGRGSRACAPAGVVAIHADDIRMRLNAHASPPLVGRGPTASQSRSSLPAPPPIWVKRFRGAEIDLLKRPLDRMLERRRATPRGARRLRPCSGAQPARSFERRRCCRRAPAPPSRERTGVTDPRRRCSWYPSIGAAQSDRPGPVSASPLLGGPRRVDRALQEPDLDGALDRLAARGGAQLAVDRDRLGLDGVARDEQPARDLRER